MIICRIMDIKRVFLLLLLQGGIVEAVSITRKWKGYKTDFLGPQKLVFTLKEPITMCLLNKNSIRICIESKELSNYGDFEIIGDFSDKDCSIVNSRGDPIAQVLVELYSVQRKNKEICWF